MFNHYCIFQFIQSPQLIRVKFSSINSFILLTFSLSFLLSRSAQLKKKEKQGVCITFIIMDTSFRTLCHSRFNPRLFPGIHFLSLPLPSFRRSVNSYSCSFLILQISTTQSSRRLSHASLSNHICFPTLFNPSVLETSLTRFLSLHLLS